MPNPVGPHVPPPWLRWPVPGTTVPPPPPPPPTPTTHPASHPPPLPIVAASHCQVALRPPGSTTPRRGPARPRCTRILLDLVASTRTGRAAPFGRRRAGGASAAAWIGQPQQRRLPGRGAGLAHLLLRDRFRGGSGRLTASVTISLRMDEEAARPPPPPQHIQVRCCARGRGEEEVQRSLGASDAVGITCVCRHSHLRRPSIKSSTGREMTCPRPPPPLEGTYPMFGRVYSVSASPSHTWCLFVVSGPCLTLERYVDRKLHATLQSRQLFKVDEMGRIGKAPLLIMSVQADAWRVFVAQEVGSMRRADIVQVISIHIQARQEGLSCIHGKVPETRQPLWAQHTATSCCDSIASCSSTFWSFKIRWQSGPLHMLEL